MQYSVNMKNKFKFPKIGDLFKLSVGTGGLFLLLLLVFFCFAL